MTVRRVEGHNSTEEVSESDNVNLKNLNFFNK
jgi:hypothetical protein